MKVTIPKLTADQWVVIGAGAAALLILGFFAFGGPLTSFWPIAEGFTAAVAVLAVWTIVPGSALDAAWGAGASILVFAEALWEYEALPDFPWVFQWICWLPLFAAAAWGARRSGWKAGLRIGLSAAFAMNLGLVLVFLAWLGQPIQATVLESAGAFDRFRSSPNTDFVTWSVGDHWNAMPLRLAVGAALGAGAGWVSRRVKWTSARA